MKSALERTVIKIAMAGERALSSLSQAKREPRIIEPYVGLATPSSLVLRGRVHSDLTTIEVDPGQGRLRNTRQMIRRFMTSEVGGAEVTCDGHSAVTDDEGYFELRLPRDGETGWIERDVVLSANGASAPCPVLAAPPGPGTMVISDIDDTVMRTGAYTLVKNLWTSFTGNVLTRQIFSDAAVLMHRLHDGGRRPVVYVSSSPWNIHGFLQDVFAHASVVRGPMFLRDLGLSETKLITEGHGNHKGQAIDAILAAVPDRQAILMGDTGQKDAVIYREAILRHPGRIAAVVLRLPGPGTEEDDAPAIRLLRETEVPVFRGRSFAAFSDEIVSIAEEAAQKMVAE